jgi:hypothetical protein
MIAADVPEVALQWAARPLLLLHAVVGMAGVGACTHLVIVAWRLRRSPEPRLGGLARLYAQVIGATYAAAFAFGLMLYPHYRYHVRGLYLDRYEPWASNLFDIKENVAALGVPLALALFFVGRRLRPEEDRALLGWLLYLAIALWASALTASLLGLLVTSVRGV